MVRRSQSAAQILEMAYQGTPVAFDILLPKANDGLAELERSIKPDMLSAWFADLRAPPKFWRWHTKARPWRSTYCCLKRTTVWRSWNGPSSPICSPHGSAL